MRGRIAATVRRTVTEGERVSICRLLPIAVLTALVTTAAAENLLNQPESVVYDAARGSYLVSNYGDGSIVRIEGGQPQSYFSSALTRTTGLMIRSGLLYAVTSAAPYVGLVAFDLATAEIVGYVPIANTGLLNDVTADSDGNFYLTDYYQHKIYKIPPSMDRYWLFVNFGSGMPNGITYDEANNRLLTVMVAAANYPIRAVSLEDSSHAVVTYTHASGMDGIVVDSEGRTYFSSWTSNAIHRYEPGFTSPHTLFSSGHSGPADIYFNPHLDIIAVPSFNRNTVEFVSIDPSGTAEGHYPPQPLAVTATSCSGAIALAFELSTPAAVRVEVLDVLGRSVAAWDCGWKTAGGYEVTWRPTTAGTGAYFYRVLAGREQARGRCILIK